MDIALGRKESSPGSNALRPSTQKISEKLGATPTYVDLRYADGLREAAARQTFNEHAIMSKQRDPKNLIVG